MNDVIQQRKELERQERIKQILNAARKLFLKKGYLNTSMRNISLESQLSTGAIYFYFKKKDEIYYKICEEALELLLQRFKETFNPRRKGLNNLRALALNYVEFYRDYQEHYQLLDTITLWRNLFSDDTRKKFQPFIRQLLEIVNKAVVAVLKEKKLAESEDSWKITFNLWAGLEGLFTIDKMAQLNGNTYQFEDLIQKQLEIFDRGLK